MIQIYTDGAARPTNPGHGAYGVQVQQEDDAGGVKIFTMRQGYLGEPVTNNQCEYIAVIVGLDYLVNQENWDGFTGRAQVLTDSNLIVNQVTEEWAMHSRSLRPLWKEVRSLLKIAAEQGWQVELQHVAGHKGIAGNEAADQLAGDAVDNRLEAPARYIQLISGSSQAKTEVQGHALLSDEVQGILQDAGCYTVAYPALRDSGMRARLYKHGGRSANIFLRTPNLLSMTKIGPVLLATQTSFVVRNDGGKGHRVLTADMWDTLTSYASIGHRVYIVHKPFGVGTWRTYRDLNWSDSLDEVELVVANVQDIVVQQIESPPGWGKTLSLGASWRSFKDVVRSEWSQ